MDIRYYCNTIEFINEREALTKWTFKVFFIKVGIFFLIGLLLLIYGIYNYDNYSRIMISTHEGYNTMVEVHNTYVNWHIAQSLGILILLFTLYLFSTNRALKKYSQEKLSKEISELQNNGGTVEVKINEKFLSVKKPSIFFKIHWNLINKYKNQGDYIFLLGERNVFAIIINKKKLTSEELQSIFQQLQKHKIKR